jgi:hypothetical protein
MGHGVRTFQTGFCALALAFATLPAAAQSVTIGSPIVVEDLRPAIDPAAEPELSAEDSALIERAIADTASFSTTPVKALRLPPSTASKALDLSRTDRPDGSGVVTFKKPLLAEWDANIGADLGLAANTPGIYSRDNPLGVIRNDRSTGAAFASVGLSKFTSVDARVDPNSDQGRVATTFKHSLALGDAFSVSLQSRASLTESLGTPQPGASDIPLRVAIGESTAPPARVWGNENVAKLDILSTGTTLGAGLSATSTDPLTHNTLSAEQKIYGPLGLATTVTDVGRASESKSLSARLKLTW